jgi:biotin carboxyl carrier protein
MKEYKFKINGKEYNVNVVEEKENIVVLSVNGKTYEVELEEKKEKTVAPIVPKPKPEVAKNEPVQPKSSSSIKSVRAPLPGNILDVKVKEGDKVTKGTTVLIMEAMKMENNIVCEFDGVVSAVKVKQGQAVMQNDILIEVE